MSGTHQTPEPPRTHSRGAWRALLILGYIAQALTRPGPSRRYNVTVIVISLTLVTLAIVVGIIRT